MRSIKFIVLLGAVTLIFQSASGLWAGSIYTWTDKNGAVHITETPPPPGAAVEDVMSTPPESPVQPIQPPPPSIGNWEVQQAEQQAQQAQEQQEAARQKAAEAEREAQQTIRQSE